LRTALFNYLFAKNRNGKLILRIEDTDRNRLVGNSETYIEDALLWAGIIPDEGPSKKGNYGPYRQSERIHLYKKMVQDLINSGKAYYAFDSNESLATLRKDEEKKGLVFKYDSSIREGLDNSLRMNSSDLRARIKNDDYVIRLKVDAGITVTDDILRGRVSFNNNVLDDKILIKTDGFPTYHFANVVDDYLMKITTVIRGEEWLPSLGIHNLIYEAFGWDKPAFIHLPLILKPVGKGKLSKRDGAKGGFPVFPLDWKGEKGFKSLGFFKNGMINYLAMLGWNPGNENEFFKMKDLISSFNIEGLQKGGAKFDFEKAKWINQQHLIKGTFIDFENEFPETVKDLKQKYPFKHVDIYLLVRDRMKLANDINKEVDFFMNNPKDFDDKVLNKLVTKISVEDVIKELIGVIERAGIDAIKENLTKVSTTKNIKFGMLMQVLRLALVGKLSGPDIIQASIILEKRVTLERLVNLKNYIS
jgi:glutamyl-tRNA synthetase